MYSTLIEKRIDNFSKTIHKTDNMMQTVTFVYSFPSVDNSEVI